jgi:hypothetical protein
VTIVGLADVMMLAGQHAQATRLLEAMLADMKYEAEDLERSDQWFVWDKPVALILARPTHGGARRAPARRPYGVTNRRLVVLLPA